MPAGTQSRVVADSRGVPAPGLSRILAHLKGYSGVSLQVRKELCPTDPVYSHPPFDMESRIVQVEHGDLVIASIYVPNGGKDYASS